MENIYMHPASIRTDSRPGSGLTHEIKEISGSRYGKIVETRQMGHRMLKSFNCALAYKENNSVRSFLGEWEQGRIIPSRLDGPVGR